MTDVNRVERIPAIMQQLEHLTASVQRLEGLIVREIQELKSEQIADLRRQNERLADDQRRAWEAIRHLENKCSQYYGGMKMAHTITATVSALIGASIAAVIAKFIH